MTKNRLLATAILLIALAGCDRKVPPRPTPGPRTSIICDAPARNAAGFMTSLCHPDPDGYDMTVNCDDIRIWCDDEGA
jgi:hypothetical protein